jgi:NAD(P)H-dependent flavin oxidoreductase YrpB (nitropropane dioxygenase family)
VGDVGAGIETRFTRLLGASAPIQLAAMPGVSTPGLVSAVAAAGGVGMLPAPMLSAEQLDRVLDGLRAADPGAFGVNFLMPFLDRECVTVAARKARLVEFFYGDPDPALVEQVHAHGARVSWQVGSLAEAIAAERAGCDLLVAQGTEAGGHVRGRTSLLPLLSEVLEAVQVPVLAAGGVATARDLAAVLGCGAAGARIGTRFVAAAESGAHPAYVKALIGASAADTRLTEAFSVMWPDAPHRVLHSSIVAAEALSDDVVGETQLGGQTVPVQRLSVICPSAETTGHVEAMALYAGESVTNVRSIQPAAAIVTELVSGAKEALGRAAGDLG